MTVQSPLSEQDTDANKAESQPKSEWSLVCSIDDLVLNSGVCALLNNKQIALFAITQKSSDTGLQIFACDNFDPIGLANVLSRGIICSVKDEPCVSSPLYKQHFSLLTGFCLEQSDVQVGVYETRIQENEVWIKMPVQKQSCPKTISSKQLGF